MPLLLSQCLVAYTFLQGTLSFLMNTLLSFFFTNLLSPHKILPLLLLSLTHRNNHGGFFFFWLKTLAEHCIVTVQWLLLLSSFLFFLFFKKNFTETLIAKTKFSLETIQNIDASSTFGRMLWLKLQQR